MDIAYFKHTKQFVVKHVNFVIFNIHRTQNQFALSVNLL